MKPSRFLTLLSNLDPHSDNIPEAVIIPKDTKFNRINLEALGLDFFKFYCDLFGDKNPKDIDYVHRLCLDVAISILTSPRLSNALEKIFGRSELRNLSEIVGFSSKYFQTLPRLDFHPQSFFKKTEGKYQWTTKFKYCEKFKMIYYATSYVDIYFSDGSSTRQLVLTQNIDVVVPIPQTKLVVHSIFHDEQYEANVKLICDYVKPLPEDEFPNYEFTSHSLVGKNLKNMLTDNFSLDYFEKLAAYCIVYTGLLHKIM